MDGPCPRSRRPALTVESDLAASLDGLSIADAARLRRRLDGVRKLRDPKRRAGSLNRIQQDAAAARLRVLERAAAVPVVSYPPELPVSRARDELAEAIEKHQVVIVAGETGSGKTTQLPKICLELGRGVKGMIGHTQPRRIAARTVAERIAEELGTELGKAVGYTVRFTDEVGPTTLVKLMTDGILLAEIQRDRMLTRYDTIIVDEAHERSLNIDFILGYLKQLLPRRPDLKVIVTSATIDPERFARHFDDAPVVEVSGRTYPVEVRYRPLDESEDEDDDSDGDPKDQIQGICEAVEELAGEGDGDVLVFLSGEREIRDTADALRAKVQTSRRLRGTEVLPLYARLSAAEQHRVFQQHAQRRIVLATNVAETSLTVPGIRYVVDPGTARISRYSYRTKVQRLPIEPISQASANQRKGRCGRVAEGICIRMYSEEDFEQRPEFTDPEILRTNLASVILQMSALGLGDVQAFPFVDPPDRRSVKDGDRSAARAGRARPRPGGPAQAAHPPRTPARPAPDRPAAGPDGARGGQAGLRPRGDGDRGGAVDPGPARAPGRAPAGRRHRARPVRRPDVGLPRLAAALDLRPRPGPGAQLVGVPPAVQAGVPELPAHPGVAGPRRAAAPAREERRRHAEREPLRGPRPHPHRAARRTAVARRREGRDREGRQAGPARPIEQGRVPRRPRARSSRSSRGRPCTPSSPRGWWPAELVETSRLFARQCAKIEPEWVEPLAQHLVKRVVQRAALGGTAGIGGGGREGDAVRRPDRRRPQRAVRPDRPGALP